tara:strand:+ start:1732 stop:2676 length:945 start_codon:yes stop_codon:yes gene_type:complete
MAVFATKGCIWNIDITNNTYQSQHLVVSTLDNVKKQLPIWRFNTVAGTKIRKLTFDGHPNTAKIFFNHNGRVQGTGVVNEFVLINTWAVEPIRIAGTGYIGPKKITQFAFGVGSNTSTTAIGGMGGASGGQIGWFGNMRLRLRRPALNSWVLEWKWNIVDYGNMGAGQRDVTAVFSPHYNSQGKFVEGGGNQKVEYSFAARGRDMRHLGMATTIPTSQIPSGTGGTRYWWVVTNNKANWGMSTRFRAYGINYFMGGTGWQSNGFHYNSTNSGGGSGGAGIVNNQGNSLGIQGQFDYVSVDPVTSTPFWTGTIVQ